jgi:outer membrane protein
MDVILAEAVVGLNRNNVEVLTVNLRATRDRFEIGDLTRTDVAQSQARLALAQGDLRSAQSSLIAAREFYLSIVGKPPVALQPPPPLAGLPDTPS